MTGMPWERAVRAVYTYACHTMTARERIKAMPNPFDSPSLTLTDPVAWNDRTWLPVTEACNTDEMFAFLRARYFAYDSETARQMATGGMFDVSSWPKGRAVGTFQTYIVVSAFAGLVRLYRASDTRELRDGSTW